MRRLICRVFGCSPFCAVTGPHVGPCICPRCHQPITGLGRFF